MHEEHESEAIERKRQSAWCQTSSSQLSYMIIVTEFCERLAYYGIGGSVVLFFQRELNMDNADADVNYSAWSAMCYITPLLGGYVADVWLGRYYTILLFASIYMVGLVFAVIAAVPVSDSNSTPTGSSSSNESALVLVLIALYIIAVGTGGIKPNVSTLGADQYDTMIEKERRAKESFFNWFYFSINCGAFVAYIGVAYICQYGLGKQHGGEQWGFFWGWLIPALAMFVGIAIFVSGQLFFGYKGGFLKRKKNKKGKDPALERSVSITSDTSLTSDVSITSMGRGSGAGRPSFTSSRMSHSSKHHSNNNSITISMDTSQSGEALLNAASGSSTNALHEDKRTKGGESLDSSSTDSIEATSQHAMTGGDVEDYDPDTFVESAEASRLEKALLEEVDGDIFYPLFGQALYLYCKESYYYCLSTGGNAITEGMIRSTNNNNDTDNKEVSLFGNKKQRRSSAMEFHINPIAVNGHITDTPAPNDANDGERNNHNQSEGKERGGTINYNTATLPNRGLEESGLRSIRINSDSSSKDTISIDTSQTSEMPLGATIPIAMTEKGYAAHLLDYTLNELPYGGTYSALEVAWVKLVYRLFPFLGVLVMFWCIYSQMSVGFQNQGCQMNLSMSGKVNGGSADKDLPISALQVFDTLAIIVVVPLFDGYLYPYLKEKHNITIPLLDRMQYGFIFTLLAMVIAGIVEIYRKEYVPDFPDSEGGAYYGNPKALANASPCVNTDEYNPYVMQAWWDVHHLPSSSVDPDAMSSSSFNLQGVDAPSHCGVSCTDIYTAGAYSYLNTTCISCDALPQKSYLSVWWQVPQFAFIGVAEVLSSVSSMEFFYNQSPKMFRSIVSSLNLLTTAAGSLLVIPLVYLVNADANDRWVTADLNDGHMDLFFFLLAVLMVVNMGILYYYQQGFVYLEERDMLRIVKSAAYGE